MLTSYRLSVLFIKGVINEEAISKLVNCKRIKLKNNYLALISVGDQLIKFSVLLPKVNRDDKLYHVIMNIFDCNLYMDSPVKHNCVVYV